MLFNSWEFLLLLFITFILFYAVPHGKRQHHWQSLILLVATAIFYGWHDWTLLTLLAISCLLNTLSSLHILRCKQRGEEARAALSVKLAVIANLLLLGIFKYAGFLSSLIPGLPESWVNYLVSIPLPIGISFYTFQGISMVVDAGRNRLHMPLGEGSIRERAQVDGAHLRDLSLYLLFFPQLIAGPIIKAHYFWPQFKEKIFKKIDWERAIRYLIAGYFMKMVVADNLATVTNALTSKEYIAQADSMGLLLLLFGYSAQIFADFGGYSMIAIGLAALFGYRFPINFNFPYMSRSLTEFWRRWNMTLSSWLRDYLYIPLGGNRKGNLRTYVNLFLVMFLGGLWHGADWRFALWGTLHGLVLAIERFLSRRPSLAGLRIPTLFRIFYTCSIACLLWTTFLIPDMETLTLYFHQLMHQFKLWDSSIFSDLRFFNVLLFGSVVVLYHAYGWYKEHSKTGWGVDLRHPYVSGGVYALMLFLILTNSGPQAGFVYFQF